MAVAKQWCFQLEKGAQKGLLHWQGRLNLKERTEHLHFPEQEWTGYHEPTSKTCTKGKKAFSYVLKRETQVEGPWTDRDIQYIPSDVPDPTELRPWQMRLIDAAKEQNGRQIHFMMNPKGGVGKSAFMRHIASYNAGIIVPPICDTAQQMAAFVYEEVKDQPWRTRMVLIDIPRTADFKMWSKMMIVVETIKDGYAYEGRNKARPPVLFERPQVIVGFNELPMKKCKDGFKRAFLQDFLSEDKIVVWTDFGSAAEIAAYPADD